MISKEKRENNQIVQKRLSREHLTRQINNVLKEYSKTRNKFLRSHSARVNFITSIYETTKDIHKTQHMTGHKSLGSIQRYIHSSLSDEDRINFEIEAFCKSEEKTKNNN